MPRKYRNLEERLLANSVDAPCATMPGPCRVWTGAKDSGGYGKIAIRSRYRDPVTGHRKIKTLCAHRVAYALYRGVPVWRLNHVIHLCDTRPCINPLHHRGTTQKQNMKDMVKKGRARNGYSHART